MNEQIENSFKSVKDITSAGEVSELVQPWHTPVPVYPHNTGMALGGFGNALTCTPNGDTPFLHAVPSEMIDLGGAELNLLDFYYKERDPQQNCLHIRDYRTLLVLIGATPLKKPNGDDWFGGVCDVERLHAIFSEIIQCRTFLTDNQQLFDSLRIEISSSTKELILDNCDCGAINRSALLDIFPGCLRDASRVLLSLVSDAIKPRDAEVPRYSSAEMHYRALYPISETLYRSQEHSCVVMKRQKSPVIQGCEKSSCLPLFETEFQITNPSDTIREVSVCQVVENFLGYATIKSRPNEQDCVYYIQRMVVGQTGENVTLDFESKRRFVGVRFKQQLRVEGSSLNGEIVFGVLTEPAASIKVETCFSNFQPEVFVDMLGGIESGRFTSRLKPRTYSGREVTEGAVCATAFVRPGETVNFSLLMSIDLPTINIGDYRSEKRYTHHFGITEKRFQKIVEYYLGEMHFQKTAPRHAIRPLTLEHAIQSIEVTQDLRKKLAELLANGFSFLAESSVWDRTGELRIRECADYPFLNSLDVYFYGSYGLLQLFPRCDGINIRSFADAIFLEDRSERQHYVYYQVKNGSPPEVGARACRSERGSVPHDMGSLIDSNPNAYTWHNVSKWIDLTPKFILLVWRNFHLTKDRSLLEYCWRSVGAAIEFTLSQNAVVCGIPLSNGVSDTFDNIPCYGVSSYCSSLWIAGLIVAAEIADVLGHQPEATYYREMSSRATEQFRRMLWCEEQGYYFFFSRPLSVSDLSEADSETYINILNKLGITVDTPSSNLMDYMVDRINDFIYSDVNVTPALYEDGKTQKDASFAAKLQRRAERKTLVASLLKPIAKNELNSWLEWESTAIHADQLIADFHLKIFGLKCITPEADKRRALKSIFNKNYLEHSPSIGAANLVGRNGEPLPYFQAQEVWIGVQFSLVLNMFVHGEIETAQSLLDQIYTNIYERAKIPFGVPEGFCQSHKVRAEDVSHSLGIGVPSAGELLAAVEKSQTFINHPSDSEAEKKELIATLCATVGRFAELEREQQKRLISMLTSPDVRYTAGRYFRPGMIYAATMIDDGATGRGVLEHLQAET